MGVPLADDDTDGDGEDSEEEGDEEADDDFPAAGAVLVADGRKQGV